MASSPDPPSSQPAADSGPPGAPLGGTRAQAIQRLQVGRSLLGGVILLVGLATAIEDRAKQTDAAAVPQAAASGAKAASATPQNDPLADAGVVPDLPAEPAATGKPMPGASGDATGKADALPAR
ncbi:MAG: hypothetical protein ACTHKM_08915 [Tsuneonella sp.]